MIEFRAARFLDAIELAPRLRPADAEEITLVWGVSPLEGLVTCLLQSDRAFALISDDRVVGLWGVSDVLHGGLKIGVPWMLAADALFLARRELARRSRAWVGRLLAGYDTLCNLTSAANRVHLRWLSWCGFKALRVHRRYGAGAAPFCEFYLVNRHRQPCERGVRETLLAREIGHGRRPSAVDLNIAGIVSRTLASDGRCGCEADLNALVSAGVADGGEAPPGYDRLLVEVARHVLRRTDGGAPTGAPIMRWCRQLLDVVETCELEPAGDAVDLTRQMARVPRRVESGRRPSLDPRRSECAAAAAGQSGPGIVVGNLASGLTLSGRVSRIQGRRLRLSALGLEPAPEQAAGIDVGELASWWSSRAPGRSTAAAGGGRAEWSCRLWREADGRDGLAAALRTVLPTLTAETPSVRAGNCLPMAATLASRLASDWIPGIRRAGVSTDFVERQRLYWMTRAWLTVVMTGSATAASSLVAQDVAALLTVREVEADMLRRDCRTVVAEDLAALLNAVRRFFPPDTESTAWLPHVAPVAMLPTVHLAQIEPALVAWYLVSGDSLRRRLLELAGSCPASARGSLSRMHEVWRAAVGEVRGAGMRQRLSGALDDARSLDG